MVTCSFRGGGADGMDLVLRLADVGIYVCFHQHLELEMTNDALDTILMLQCQHFGHCPCKQAAIMQVVVLFVVQKYNPADCC